MILMSENTNTPRDRLTHKEFISIVNSYDHVFHAVEDGVGITHSFPPRGDMEYSWKKIIHAYTTSHELEKIKDTASDTDKRSVEEFYKRMQ